MRAARVTLEHITIINQHPSEETILRISIPSSPSMAGEAAAWPCARTAALVRQPASVILASTTQMKRLRRSFSRGLEDKIRPEEDNQS
jgi:hypothetical protein